MKKTIVDIENSVCVCFLSERVLVNDSTRSRDDRMDICEITFEHCEHLTYWMTCEYMRLSFYMYADQ